jgi:hypothetical protein
MSRTKLEFGVGLRHAAMRGVFHTSRVFAPAGGGWWGMAYAASWWLLVGQDTVSAFKFAVKEVGIFFKKNRNAQGKREEKK